MNDGEMIIELFVIQIIIILLLAVVIVFLFKSRQNINLNKKFSKYTINPIKEEVYSIFDKIQIVFDKLVKTNVRLLKKIKIFDKYASKYDKHINFEEINIKDGMYFVSAKFIIGFFVLILYILTQVFQYTNIAVLGSVISYFIGFFVIDIFLQIQYSKKRKQIEEDLLKAIIIMNNAFKSGRSTMQAIELVKNELTGPISDEFKKIHLDISYGLSLEVVFDRFYNRVKIEDAKYITSSLTLLNKTGGNIIKVFASIEKEFFSKKKLMNELKTLTSSSVFVFKVLLFVPIFLVGVIFLLNNEYFNPLFNTTIGVLILSLIMLLYIFYIIFIKKILRVVL